VPHTITGACDADHELPSVEFIAVSHLVVAMRAGDGMSDRALDEMPHAIVCVVNSCVSKQESMPEV
jgi:hypothetical protein